MNEAPSVTRTVIGDAAVATPVGEFDLAWAEVLREELLAAVKTDPRLVVDLSQTTFMDSTAIGALVSVHRVAMDCGGWLRLVAPLPNVLKVLQVTGLDAVLAISDSIGEAIGSPTTPAAPVT